MTAHFWDRMAPTYESDNAAVAGSALIERMRSEIADAVARLTASGTTGTSGTTDTTGGRVVELGCGTGWFTRAYAPRCDGVLATDYSPAMLAQARRTLAGVPHVTFLRADATATGLPAADADAVVVANVLDIVPAPGAVLVEAARLLRPGGALLVANFAIEGTTLRQRASGLVRLLGRWRLITGGRRGRFLTCAELAGLASAAGLRVDENRLLAGRSMNALFLRATRTG